MRILFLSQWFPYPMSNGSKVRIYNLLAGLARRHEVTLLSFVDSAGVDTQAPAMQKVCAEIQSVVWKPFTPESLRARLGFFGMKPRSVVDTYSPEMAAAITQTLASKPYDLVIASQWGMAGYADCFGETPALMEEAEIGMLLEPFARVTSPVRRARHNLTWFKQRHYIAGLLRRFALCTVASEQERKLLASVAPEAGPVEVIQNCINLNDYAQVKADPQPGTLIFTGSFRYVANHEAMVWFLQEAYPQIQAQLPETQLTITGDHANLPLPPASNITLTGFVDDVWSLVAGAWISLAPLRSGGGTRVKILEAMALGTPVVATSKGAEGLDVRHGEHLLIADTPDAYAAAVVQLLQDADLRARLARNAYAVVRAHYDWNAVLPRFLELVERAAAKSPSAPHAVPVS